MAEPNDPANDPGLGDLDRLPLELRILIYEHLFGDVKPLDFDFVLGEPTGFELYMPYEAILDYEYPDFTAPKPPLCAHAMSALSRTGRQIATESRPVFFATAVFELSMVMSTESHVSSPYQHLTSSLKMMRNVAINNICLRKHEWNIDTVFEFLQGSRKQATRTPRQKTSRETFMRISDRIAGYPEIQVAVKLKVNGEGGEHQVITGYFTHSTAEVEDTQRAEALLEVADKVMSRADLSEELELSTLERLMRVVEAATLADRRWRSTR
ncbi:hypothetical protein LTR08_001523 [Meristemomyces frigidus]|nr:hypothetical protein LTR08_001523 [Meristemomyces frigidus]